MRTPLRSHVFTYLQGSLSAFVLLILAFERLHTDIIMISRYIVLTTEVIKGERPLMRSYMYMHVSVYKYDAYKIHDTSHLCSI